MNCPYEPGRPIEEVRRELGLTRVIKLASNENPLGPSVSVIETLNRSDLGLQMYPDFEGVELRAALAEELGVPASRILLGAGSAELMRLVADVYLDRGYEGVANDIAFPIYADVIRIAGGTLVAVPLEDDLQSDLGRMLAAVTRRTKVVFLASPNNPTGKAVSLADLTQFLEKLPPSVICVLDLAYCEYASSITSADALKLLAGHANLVILRTFSKAYALAGLRIGYAVAAEDVTAWLGRVRIPFSTNTAAQVAARVALSDHEHVARSVEVNRQALVAMDRELRALDLTPYSSEGNFMLVETGCDSEVLFQELLRRGVIVRPMRHPRLSTCVRISAGTLEQVGILAGALREVLAEAGS
jgi:histidinol-phosphate aminotransferase